jgi:hypothetical protein
VFILDVTKMNDGDTELARCLPLCEAERFSQLSRGSADFSHDWHPPFVFGFGTS